MFGRIEKVFEIFRSVKSKIEGVREGGKGVCNFMQRKKERTSFKERETERERRKEMEENRKRKQMKRGGRKNKILTLEGDHQKNINLLPP